MVTRGGNCNNYARKGTQMITRGGYSNDYCNDYEAMIL